MTNSMRVVAIGVVAFLSQACDSTPPTPRQTDGTVSREPAPPPPAESPKVPPTPPGKTVPREGEQPSRDASQKPTAPTRDTPRTTPPVPAAAPPTAPPRAEPTPAAPPPAAPAPTAPPPTESHTASPAPSTQTPATTLRAAAPQTAQAPSAPTPTAPPKAAPLDLGSLEQRLRDTKAIGVFTKLSLKNQVDDLLQQFREFHKSRDQSMLSRLRQTYDLLLLKVLSLLQDGDPALARDVSSSREALWGILVDPDKFKNL